MKPLSVEDGITDEQAVRQVHSAIQITKPVKVYPFWAAYSASNEFLGRGASELLMWAHARAKLPIRSATPEELTAQRESYGKNYKPGPIQATPFMPEAVTEQSKLSSDDMGKFDRWLQAQPEDFQMATYHNAFHEVLRDFVEDDVKFQAERVRYLYESIQENKMIQGVLDKFIKCDPTLFAQSPTLPVPERTAEMDELMGRLREKLDSVAHRVCDCDCCIAIRETLSLLDHIEGKPK